MWFDESIVLSHDLICLDVCNADSLMTLHFRNLGDLEGDEICISNPLGDYAIPRNSHGDPTIITTTAYVGRRPASPLCPFRPHCPELEV